MKNVINRRADSRPPNVSNEAEIRRKKKDHKQQPRMAASGVDQNGRGQYRQTFQPQPAAHPPDTAPLHGIEWIPPAELLTRL